MKKSVLVTYLLWLFFGYFGIHRFYCGKMVTGVIWILTGGLFLIGWLIDVFLIPGMVRAANDAAEYKRKIMERLTGKDNTIQNDEWVNIVDRVIREMFVTAGMNPLDKLYLAMSMERLAKIKLTCAGCGHKLTLKNKKGLMLFDAVKCKGLSEDSAQPLLMCPWCCEIKGLVVED